jgi:hypothetical protein
MLENEENSICINRKSSRQNMEVARFELDSSLRHNINSIRCFIRAIRSTESSPTDSLEIDTSEVCLG